MLLQVLENVGRIPTIFKLLYPLEDLYVDTNVASTHIFKLIYPFEDLYVDASSGK